MDAKQRQHLQDWQPILETFISPLDVAEKLSPVLEVGGNVISHVASTHETLQTHELMEMILASDNEGIYDRFVLALRSCENLKWLHELMFDDNSDVDLSEHLSQVENFPEFKRLMCELSPSLHNIKPFELLTDVRSLFGDHEWNKLKADVDKYGETTGLCLILLALPKRGPGWKTKLWEHAKRNNLRKSEGYGSIADTLQRIFNIEEGSENIEMLEGVSSMEVDQPCTSASAKLTANIEDPSLQPGQSIPTKRAFSSNAEVIPCEAKQPRKDEVQCSSDVQSNVTGNSIQRPVTAKLQQEKCIDEITLLKHQVELLNKVPDGESTIVCAPTGSGKTLVAAHLIKKTLERTTANAERKYKCKVVFSAPSVVLVNQQTKKLQEYFGNKYLVDCMHGGETENIFYFLNNCDIVCLTPQILLDAVERKSAEVSLKDFDLLVFDECHHCTGMDPYNKLMKEYLHLKSKCTHRLPQVIGLTATLGIGKTTSLTKGMEYILQICANLNAFGGIATVTKNIDSLRQKPSEKRIKLQERGENPLSLKLIETMDEIITMLEELDVYSFFSWSPQLKNFLDLKMGTFQFDQNCSILEKLINESEFLRPRDAHACNEYLQICSKALDRQYKLTPFDCLNLLRKYLEEREERTGKVENRTEEKLFAMLQEIIPELEELSTLPECRNQYLELMKHQIVDQFDLFAESRVMVMVEERSQTVAIKRWMNDNDDLKQYKAEYLVGVAQKNQDDVAMDEKKQQIVMDGFQQGRHKILVCTSEATGEGIDVSNCNMVLCYDYSKNEIGLVQQAGRVRDEEGQVVKLSTAEVQKKDEKNMFKVMVMEKATEAVRRECTTNKVEYTEKLKKLQKCIVAEYIQYRIALKMKKEEQQVNQKEYRIECRKCRVHVCSSNDVRRVFDGDSLVDKSKGAKYINISEEFKTKYIAVEHPKIQPMGPNWNKKNKIACAACGKPWGIIAEWRQLLKYPLMKIDGFRIVDPDNPKLVQLPRQWQYALFEPPIARLEDLVDIPSQDTTEEQNV